MSKSVQIFRSQAQEKRQVIRMLSEFLRLLNYWKLVHVEIVELSIFLQCHILNYNATKWNVFKSSFQVVLVLSTCPSCLLKASVPVVLVVSSCPCSLLKSSFPVVLVVASCPCCFLKASFPVVLVVCYICASFVQ